MDGWLGGWVDEWVGAPLTHHRWQWLCLARLCSGHSGQVPLLGRWQIPAPDDGEISCRILLQSRVALSKTFLRGVEYDLLVGASLNFW